LHTAEQLTSGFLLVLVSTNVSANMTMTVSIYFDLQHPSKILKMDSIIQQQAKKEGYPVGCTTQDS